MKDKVLIWLSQYKASALEEFLQAIKLMPTLKIVEPLIKDQEEALKMYGRYSLGISDLINLSIIKRLNLDGIYTNDKGFLETSIKVVFSELSRESDFQEFLKILEEKGYTIKK